MIRRSLLPFFLLPFLIGCAPTVAPIPTNLPAPSATPPPQPSATQPGGSLSLPTVTPGFAGCFIATPCASTETPAPTNSPILQSPTPSITPPPNHPIIPPDPGAYTLHQITGGLVRPTYLTHAGDASGRLFVLEQPGRIRIIQNGLLLPAPFLDLEPVVGSESNEQGLLGLAFHPDYSKGGSGTGESPTRPYFFVNFTDNNGDTVIERFSVSPDDPNQADPASGLVLLHVAQPFPNHNGGDLVFGPDGYLYIGLGDGGSAGDPQGNGQKLNTLLGKLLRIDVNQPAYAIPPGNPFATRPEARPEIWAYGLRNPWRFSFDRATGDLFIGDVGQNAYEEIDYQPAGSAGGENYGWNFWEGNHLYEVGAPGGLTAPVVEYSHDEGGCAVTGGYVYRGAQLPGLNGIYFFGDYCSGKIWALYRDASGWQKLKLFATGFLISSFGEDEAGELYVLDHSGGAVYQFVAAP